MSNRWLLQNGSILDGSGADAQTSDVLINGDTIEDVGVLGHVQDAHIIDCTGMTIAPGFIDAHSHSDLQVLEGRREKLLQGVTTEVVGNCGFSAYPPARDPAELRQFANGIFCGDEEWGWASSDAYLRAIEKSATANVVSLVGHGSLRIAVAGSKQGPLPDSDVERMCGLLEEAFAAGAAGFSTGLMYAPGSSAPESELRALCAIVAKHAKLYATHMRSYFHDLVPAIEEQLNLARATGCKLQISHLQAVGAANWPQQTRALDTIEQAAAEGIDIAFDCYPYVAGSTVLTQVLPQWALEGGTDAMVARLADVSERDRIAREITAAMPWRWQDIYISAAPDQSVIGRNLQQIADARACAPAEAMFDLLVAHRGAVNMLSFNQSEENLRRTLTHPLAIVISDGFYVRGRPHPRLHGTFPCLLGDIVRERGWMTLPEAIHKITRKPADRLNLRGRGHIHRGASADITVFDAKHIHSPATYESPDLPPVGVQHVFRNGKPSSPIPVDSLRTYSTSTPSHSGL